MFISFVMFGALQLMQAGPQANAHTLLAWLPLLRTPTNKHTATPRLPRAAQLVTSQNAKHKPDLVAHQPLALPTRDLLAKHSSLTWSLLAIQLVTSQ